MKSLQQFIKESTTLKFIDLFDRAKFKIETKTDSTTDKTDRNSTAKKQEKEIVDQLNNKVFIDTNYKAITIEDYAESIGKKWSPKYDLQNGDIVLIENDKPIAFIDVKVSDSSRTLGAISIKSLLHFGKNSKNHYYLLLSDKGFNHRFVDANKLWKAFEKNPTLMVSKDRKNKIDFEASIKGWKNYQPDGFTYEEDFIPTSFIDKIN